MGFKNQTEKRITSWAPSKLDLYFECPAKAKYKFIDKLPEPPSPHLDRGIAIHKAAEDFVTSRNKKLHADLKGKNIKALITQLQAEYKLKKVRVELELAFDAAWKLVDWFSKEVVCRFKVDVFRLVKPGVANAIDWKTGKLKDEHAKYDQQLNGYAVAILSAGLASKVTAQLAFTDADAIVESPSGTLTEKDLVKAQKAWDKKAKPMLTDTKFAPRPGDHCRYCPYSTNKGGPCEF